MSLDLSKLGFRVKKAEAEHNKAQTATLSAIILASGDNEVVTKAQAVLSAHGIDFTEHTQFEDGTVALHKEETAFADGGAIVRMNANVAVVLDNMGDHLKNLQKSAFGEAAKSNGYFDGPGLVLATTNEVIKSCVQKADSPATAATAVRDTMEAAQQYLDFLTMALPSAVLKVETQIDELVKGEFIPGKKGVNPFAKKKPEVEDVNAESTEDVEEESTETSEEEDAETAPKVSSKKKKKVVAAEEDTEDDLEEDTEDDLEEEDTASKKKKVVAGGAAKKPVKKEEVDDTHVTSEQMEKVLKAMSDMAFAVATLTKNVGTLSADITQIKKSTEEKIDVLAKKAETAAHAVRGTVLASEIPGDPQPIAKIKKVDTDPRTGVFDSAMLYRAR